MPFKADESHSIKGIPEGYWVRPGLVVPGCTWRAGGGAWPGCCQPRCCRLPAPRPPLLRKAAPHACGPITPTPTPHGLRSTT